MRNNNPYVESYVPSSSLYYYWVAVRRKFVSLVSYVKTAAHSKYHRGVGVKMTLFLVNVPTKTDKMYLI